LLTQPGKSNPIPLRSETTVSSNKVHLSYLGAQVFDFGFDFLRLFFCSVPDPSCLGNGPARSALNAVPGLFGVTLDLDRAGRMVSSGSSMILFEFSRGLWFLIFLALCSLPESPLLDFLFFCLDADAESVISAGDDAVFEAGVSAGLYSSSDGLPSSSSSTASAASTAFRFFASRSSLSRSCSCCSAIWLNLMYAFAFSLASRSARSWSYLSLPDYR
jgi:hypothetical protein